MRTLILLAAVSLAVIIRATGNPSLSELKYGDILAFPRTKLPWVLGLIPYKYKHYGIYLDKKEFPGKRADQNLFHFTGPTATITFANCIFAVLDTSKPFEKDNYLDNYPEFKNTDRMSEENITRRIIETHNCKKHWYPCEDNCEHLATYVRYGYKFSFQLGQQAERRVKNPTVGKEMDEAIKKYLNETYNDIHEEVKQTCGCDGAAAAGDGAAAAG